jgi:hypothetical protein
MERQLWRCWPATPGACRRARRPSAPIKAFGNPIGDILVRRPYTELQALLDATQPKGRRYYWKSEYLPRIDPSLCEKVIEHAASIRSPYPAIILFQVPCRSEDGNAEPGIYCGPEATTMVARITQLPIPYPFQS